MLIVDDIKREILLCAGESERVLKTFYALPSTAMQIH